MNFHHSTLLLASGVSYFGISDVSAKKFLLYENGVYELEIELTINNEQINTPWVLPVQIFKNYDVNSVTLKFNIIEEVTENLTEIPIDIYSLAGTMCELINIFPETIRIINSNEAFENNITCFEGTFPEIDFSNYTLLIARGNSPSSPSNLLSSSFFKNEGTREYVLKLTIHKGMLGMPSIWQYSFIVPKITDEEIVTLSYILTSNTFD